MAFLEQKMIVKEITVKDYLSVSKIGDFTINPYVGCPHACMYCYAEFMKRFTNHPEPWGKFIDIKRCSAKINLKKVAGKNVFMSSVTDCYNPYEAKYQITRSILEQLAESECRLRISTRNKLILRDLDILKKFKHLEVAMSVNTFDESFRRDTDLASSIAERLETLKTLHDNGIYIILFMSPIFIGITDWQAIIETSRNYISEYWFEFLNLRGGYKSRVLNYIKEKYPQLFPLYEQIYVKGDRTEVYKLEKAVMGYCEQQKIKHTNYFYHEDLVREARDKKLANRK